MCRCWSHLPGNRRRHPEQSESQAKSQSACATRRIQEAAGEFSVGKPFQQFGMEKFARDGISPGHYCGHDRKRQRPTIGAAQIIQRHRHHRRRDPTCSCVPTPDALRVKSRVDQNGTFDKKAQPFRDPLAFCSRFQLTDGPDYRTAPTLIS